MPQTVNQVNEGDTIIVKGERNWSRPSSPESSTPEIAPLVANLLAQINNPKPSHQQLESPGPEDSTGDNGEENGQPGAVFDLFNSRSRQKNMEEKLLAMPERRQLPWREGVEPGAETETGGESRRKQIRFGCLLATRGEVQAEPCYSCSNGRGKFSVCVALDGFFKGACASCQLSGRPNRCSIKKDDGGFRGPSLSYFG